MESLKKLVIESLNKELLKFDGDYVIDNEIKNLFLSKNIFSTMENDGIKITTSSETTKEDINELEKYLEKFTEVKKHKTRLKSWTIIRQKTDKNGIKVLSVYY